MARFRKRQITPKKKPVMRVKKTKFAGAADRAVKRRIYKYQQLRRNHPNTRFNGEFSFNESRAIMRAQRGFIRAAQMYNLGTRAAPYVQAQFMNRNFRQKPLVGLTNFKNKMFTTNTMYSGGLTRQRVPSAGRPRVKATNRKNKGSKGGPKRTFRASKVKGYRKIVQKQIKDLQKSVNAEKAHHTHRYATSGRVVTVVAECDHVALDVNTPTLLEGYTNNLRWFDVGAGAIVTSDPTSLTISQEMVIKDIHSKLRVRNNYLTPVRVKVYLCTPKSDTNDSVLTTYTAGIADQVTTAGVDTETPLIYLSDIDLVKQQWNLDVVLDKTLLNGGEATCSHSTGSFKYNPSMIDTETAAYQKGFRAHQYVIRCEGIIGHDSVVTTEQALVRGGVDYELVVKTVIEYQAGLALNDYSINDTRDQSFTNSDRVGTATTPSIQQISI